MRPLAVAPLLLLALFATPGHADIVTGFATGKITSVNWYGTDPDIYPFARDESVAVEFTYDLSMQPMPTAFTFAISTGEGFSFRSGGPYFAESGQFGNTLVLRATNWVTWMVDLSFGGDGSGRLDFYRDIDFRSGSYESFTATLTRAPAAVPEPSTVAVSGLVMAGLGTYGWRNRKRAAA